MNLLEIAALCACLFNLALAIFVLRQDVRSRLHGAYFLWGLGVSLWNLGCVFLYQGVSHEAAIFWAKMVQFGVILAPLGFYETARLISGRPENRKATIAFLALHGLFAISLVGHWFVKDVRFIGTIGYWAEPGWLFWGYPVSYCVLIYSPLIFLFQAMQKASSLQRTRLRAMLIALLLMSVAGTNDFLPILHIDTYPLIGKPFYPFGNIAACVYMMIVAYSVLQHTLLDVHVALGRYTAHAVRFGFLAVCSLCLLMVITLVFPDQFTGVAFWGALLVQILSAITASTLFPRLFGAGAETFERKILGDRLEYRDQVRTFVQSMTWFTDFTSLFSELHSIMVKSFRVEGYTVLLRDVTGSFQLYRTHPAELTNAVPEMSRNAPLVRYFEGEQATLLTAAGLRVGPAAIEEEAREQLLEFNAALCFGISSHEETIGFLLVGKKVGGDPFTVTDINLFTSLVKAMGVVVNQIRMKMQIMQAQEFELLGRMSSGMAHDLNNLLTPVSTLLQLGGESGVLDDELLPVAARNVMAIRAYIREGLFFSEHHRLDVQAGRLDLLIARAIEVARASRTAGVTVINEVAGEVWAEMDSVMVQRLLANLITNAIDASPAGSTVTVAVDQRRRTEEERDWLRIRVIDEGKGIAAADLDRVFTPYFTTKNTGDSHRGFGLGLAICRKIASLHGGELSIDSELNRGTTVIFDLPSKQIFPAATESSVNFRAA